MPDHDAHEGGERVNGGVFECGLVGLGDFGGKGQHRRAGVRTGEQAADFREGQFAPEAGDDGGNQQRHGGDNDAERHPVEAVAVFERGKEGGADA